MDFERFNRQLDFLVEIDKVKQILRNTILMDSSRQENDAEHAWHMAVAAMTLQEYANAKELDMAKVLKMALLHDLVEIDAGDTFAYDEKGHLDKAEREAKAAGRIFGLLPADQCAEFRSLWEEFEEGKSPEACFAIALDSFMPLLHNYRTKGRQWQKHNITSSMVLERNRGVAKGSEELWSYINSIVADAVEKGYLKP